MTLEPTYQNMAAVLEDVLFPEVDVALRQGRHIHRGETERYAFLTEANDYLERWYRRYGCDLVRTADGYFYLLPQVDKVRRRQLGLAEMLLGKVLALLYLEPATLQRGGVVERTQALQSLTTLVGQENLLLRLNPRRTRRDERTEQENVRKELDRALRVLCELGFADRLDEDQVRLQPPILRFAESVRGVSDPHVALAEMIRAGRAVSVSPENCAEGGEGSASEEDAERSAGLEDAS